MTASAENSRANILLIYVDDMGWSDAGCYGSDYYETPNIDKLAESGLRFHSAYANGPNCQPSRAALLTGQYGGRTGINNVGYSERGESSWRSLITPVNEYHLNLSHLTFADVLTPHGYDCAYIGKWHLGEYEGYLPSDRGFEARRTFPQYEDRVLSANLVLHQPFRWAHFHYGPAFGNSDGAFQVIFGSGREDPRSSSDPLYRIVDEEIAAEGDYLSDFLTDQAIEFLSSRQGQDRPFLLVLSDYLPHAPVNAPEDLVKRFRQKPRGEIHNHPVMAAMLKQLDFNVGRLIRALDDYALRESTLVIFKSDNGGVGGYHQMGIPNADEYTSNSPLRGGKTQLYEGGIRIPMILNWPGRVKAGAVCNVPVTGLDLFPTFLEVAGIDVDDWQSKHEDHPLDGLSLMNLFTDPESSLKRDFIAFHYPAYALDWPGPGWRSTPVSAIRWGDYKLIEHLVSTGIPGDGSRIELYDLSHDIGETMDISDARPVKAKMIHRVLADWREQTGAMLPVKKDIREGMVLELDGIQLQNLTPEIAAIVDTPTDRGLIVIGFDKRRFPRLLTSSVVTRVDGAAVASIDGLEEILQSSDNRTIELEIQFRRCGEPQSLELNRAQWTRTTLDAGLFTDSQEFTVSDQKSNIEGIDL